VSVDDLRQQLRERGYLSHGIERWFALDPWSSRMFWVELIIVAAKGALLIGAFAMLPLVAIMLFRNHPLTGWETLLMAVAYGGTAFAAGFLLLIVLALILKLRPALALDTPRALLGISFAVSALLTASIAIWWSQFGSAPSLPELLAGLILTVTFFLIATVVISAALLSFSIYELKRVPAIHQRSRGAPMSIAAAILTALLFLPAYAAQERRAPESPIQVVTSPTAHRIAFIAVDGLTYELARSVEDSGPPLSGQPRAAVLQIPAMSEKSTTERWASIGIGVPSRLHGVRAVEGVRFRGGRHLVQSLSNADLVLHDIAPPIGLAHREPLPPTVRRRDFVWEIFAARGVPSLSVNWWTTDDLRSGALESIGQASIFAAAANNPVELDSGASKRALDGVAETVKAMRQRRYELILLGLPGDRQSGRGVLVSTIPLARPPASAYDVAPTLCALMGFPASSEMPGTSLVPTELPRIAGYGPRTMSRENVKVNDEYYQNLKSLGYIK